MLGPVTEGQRAGVGAASSARRCRASRVGSRPLFTRICAKDLLVFGGGTNPSLSRERRRPDPCRARSTTAWSTATRTANPSVESPGPDQVEVRPRRSPQGGDGRGTRRSGACRTRRRVAGARPSLSTLSFDCPRTRSPSTPTATTQHRGAHERDEQLGVDLGRQAADRADERIVAAAQRSPAARRPATRPFLRCP